MAVAREAIRLDPSLGQPHATIGFIRTFWEWKLTEAEIHFKNAIALEPSYATAHQWYALNLAARNSGGSALGEIYRAHELEPSSPAINADLCQILYLARKFDQAIEQCRRTLEIDPDFLAAHQQLYAIYAEAGQPDNAIRSFMAAGRAAKLPTKRRSILTVYALRAYLANLDKELPSEKTKRFGIEAEYDRWRDSTMKYLSDLAGRIYRLTISLKITPKMPPTKPLFTIYRISPELAGAEKLQGDLRFEITSEMLALLAIEARRLDVRKVVTQETGNSTWGVGISYRTFDESAQASLRGDCDRNVRIMYSQSRYGDALRAERTLEENNYAVDLQMRPGEETSRKKGKILFRKGGDAERAKTVADLVRRFEVLSPEQGGMNTGQAPSDFEIWLSGNDACGVRKRSSVVLGHNGYFMKPYPEPERNIRTTVDTSTRGVTTHSERWKYSSSFL